MRHVIAHQQSRPACRHVLLTDDADSIHGVSQQPQAEADEELRNPGQHVDAAGDGHQTAREEHAFRRE